MAELSAHTGHACTSFKLFAKTVPSSDGSSSYRVEYGPSEDPWARGQEFDWTCDCQDFQIRRKKKSGDYCKHIKDGMKERCGWYRAFDPDKQSIRAPLKTCPSCGGKVETAMFLVPGDEKAPVSRAPKDALSESGITAILNMVHAPPGDSVHERITKLGKLTGGPVDVEVNKVIEMFNESEVGQPDQSLYDRCFSAAQGINTLQGQLREIEKALEETGVEGINPPEKIRNLIELADQAKIPVEVVEYPYDINIAMELAASCESALGIFIDRSGVLGLPDLLNTLCADQTVLQAVKGNLPEDLEGTVPDKVREMSAFFTGRLRLKGEGDPSSTELKDRILVLERNLVTVKVALADAVIEGKHLSNGFAGDHATGPPF